MLEAAAREPKPVVDSAQSREATRASPRARPRTSVQAKLAVGRTDDPLERQADRVAAEVIANLAAYQPERRNDAAADESRIRRSSMAASPAARVSRIARREPAADSLPAVGRNGGELDGVAEAAARSTAGGQPLDRVARSIMEPAFAADFGAVRVHTDSLLAPKIGASAFTLGRDVHFAPGTYDPASTAGREILAHELTHVVQQGAAPPHTIRRKVGFEFENARWAPWRIDRAPVDGGPPEVTPVARKKKLHLGYKFRLEGDDTPGPDRSNTEFVTEPFEETLAGIAALVAALLEMRTIMARFEGNAGVKGPTANPPPPYPYDPFDYLTERVHGLSGSADIPRSNIGISDGREGGFKMQATMGLTLGEIPEAMETYGNVAPGKEGQQETANRAKARALQGAKGFADVLGRAPRLAVLVLRGIVDEAELDEREKTKLRDRSKMRAAQGYVAVVMTYLKGMRFPDKTGTEGVKARTMFLARNKFSALYAMLDPAVQALLGRDDGALFKKHMLIVSNANPLWARVQGQLPDTALTLDMPLINSLIVPPIGAMPAKEAPMQKVLSPFTIGDWLADVAVGDDHLTIQGMQTWLAANTGVDPGTAKEASGWVMESLGEYATDTSGARELALFENRGILGSDVKLGAAARVAYNYLCHARATKIRGPGQPYPDNDIPGW